MKVKTAMARRRCTVAITLRLFVRSTTTPAIVLKRTPGSAKATMIPETAVDDLLMPSTATSRARLMTFDAVCEIACEVHIRRNARFRKTAIKPVDDWTSMSATTAATGSGFGVWGLGIETIPGTSDPEPPTSFGSLRFSGSLDIGGFRGTDRGELLRRRARAALNKRLHTPRQHTAWHQDAMTAAEADEADVCAEPDDTPVRTTAGMWLPEADNVVNRNVEQHGYSPFSGTEQQRLQE